MSVRDDQAWIFVLDEYEAHELPWMRELDRHFRVRRTVSMVGVQRLMLHRKASSAVLHMTSPEARAKDVIETLRTVTGPDLIPIVVLTHGTATDLQAALKELPSIDVVEATRANFVLRPRLMALTAAHTRPGVSGPPSPLPRSARSATRCGLQARFFSQGAERARRALAICTDLRRTDLLPVTRKQSLRELKDLLNLMKGEATLLKMKAMAEVLTLAEEVVARLDGERRGLVVPRGVLSLLGELVEFQDTGDLGASFDLELHRVRLLAGGNSNSTLRPPRS